MTSKLEKIRVARGLSQRKLEDLSGVSQQTISRIEKGTPLYKANTAAKLAKVLNCKISDIMDNVDDGIDKLSTTDLKNIHTFIKALRNLLKLNPRKVAALLNMEEKEYLSYEDETKELSVDEGLSIISILIFMHTATKISHSLKSKDFPQDSSDDERRVLEAMRALNPDKREGILHYLKAANLLDL